MTAAIGPDKADVLEAASGRGRRRGSSRGEDHLGGLGGVGHPDDVRRPGDLDCFQRAGALSHLVVRTGRDVVVQLSEDEPAGDRSPQRCLARGFEEGTWKRSCTI
jgi:hypothetical protein